MERLEVKGKETDKIKSLSKGNQQKLQLIATLIHEPDLIILDEPFSGLDPVNASILKEVIKAERERGAMIIFSDHNMANVEELCDQVVLLSQGNIALQGTIKEVRESFGKTRLFVSSQLTKDELEELPHVISASKTQLGSWCLTLDNENAGKELFTVLTKGDYIQTFDQQAPSLDEIFRMKAR
jgi:ABC-2 type transport system ATP-binding protein